MKAIKIKGVDIPARYSAKALREFGRLTGRERYSDLLNIGTDMTLEDMVTFIYCGLKSGAAYNNIQLEFTVEDVWDAMDEDAGIIGAAFNQYNEDQPPASEEAEKKTMNPE